MYSILEKRKQHHEKGIVGLVSALGDPKLAPTQEKHLRPELTKEEIKEGKDKKKKKIKNKDIFVV